MIEAEWLACADPKPMLVFLQWNASARKSLLFNVACCRRIWHLLLDERSRTLVEQVERFADGKVTIFDVSSAADLHDSAQEAYDFKAPWWAAMYAPSSSNCQETATDAAEAVGCAAWWDRIPEDDPAIESVHSVGRHAELEAQCSILRDIFGPQPFRPLSLHSSSLSNTVSELAQAIYDDRSFDRLPELADAMQKAGCDSEEILNHLRGVGPHVRGCWALDLVLGKK